LPSASPFARSLVAHAPRPILTWLFCPSEAFSTHALVLNPRLGLSSVPSSATSLSVSEPEGSKTARSCHLAARGLVSPRARWTRISITKASSGSRDPTSSAATGLATPPEGESVLTGLDRLATITRLPRPSPRPLSQLPEGLW